MKKVLILLTLIIIGNFCMVNIYAKEDLPLQYRIVVIDPGHGFLDCGASEFGYQEATINLQIAKQLKKELKKYGATVYMTRNNDRDVTNRDYNYSKQDDMYLRVKKIDSFNGHYLISIHLNACGNSSAWGSQVFYYKNSSNGKKLAKVIDKNMKKITNSNKPISSCGFRVLRATKTLGVLIECGFLSNYNECGQLRNSNYQKKLATSITKGIIAYDKKVKKNHFKTLD